MTLFRTITKFYIKGGYRGMLSKFGKRITEYFDSYDEALHYKQCYGCFSLSLEEGEIVEEQFYL